MKIAFNPSTVAALITPPNNKDITFDLRGRNIFARGVKFQGTDTWRDIKINNVSIDSNILDLQNGSNTTLTNTNGVVTINSTWRPVVDNLTSDSTTSSLSANQGRVLAGLIKSLDTNVSNDYALRNGSNATGRWRGGLACLDVRDTNYTPHDLNVGLELLFLRNITNNLTDGGEYNGVFSFRQWASGTDWSGGKAHLLSFTDNGNIWHRTSSGDDSWGAWKKLAYSTDIPSSLKNPHALTISLNGTSQGPYDGSATKNINITPGSIGAATSEHNHDNRYLKLTGGTMQLGEGLKFHADDNYFGTNSDARIISLLDGNGKVCDGGLIIDERGTLDGKEYVTELLRIRDSEFKWKGSNILHSGNTYVNNNKGYIYGNEITLVNNADTVDGYHASSLVKFYLSPMTSNAPADSAKNWFVNTMPSASGAIVYNVPGSEKTIIAGKSSGAYGHMLQLNYDDNYLRILRYVYGSWKSTDWEKISAGYADSAGSVAWDNITGKPSSYIPSAHTHAWNSLTHSSTTENQAILTNGSANGWKLYTLNIARWDNAANNAHSHANKSVLDGITSALVNNWNTAFTFVNTITGTDTDKVINKWDEIVNFLAGITEDNKLNTLLNSKLSVYELANNTNVGAIKNNGIYYSTSDASSGTLTNSPFNTGFALINMTSYDGGDDLRRSRLAFNAYGEIKVSNDRGLNNTTETWYQVLTSHNTYISNGSGIINGTTITLVSNADTTDGVHLEWSGQLTYDLYSWLAAWTNDGKKIKAVNKSLFATSGHTHDDRYLKLTGGTMSGTIYRNSGGTTISGRDHAIIRLTYAPGGSSWNPIACVDTETGTWTLGHLSSGDSDTNFHFCFSTNTDYNAGNNNGNYVTLRNKVGTIALLSEIPDKNSWNYDDRYLKLTGGTMNGNARIGYGSGNLYIGNSGNDGWVAVQDICSLDSIGDGKWSIRVDGTASFQSIKFPSNRLIAQVSNGSNSPLKGIKLPDLQNNGIGIFSRVGNGSDEGGIVLSEDTCVIYNSFNTGWGLSVRDKDKNQTDISGDDTIAFGVRQDYRAYSLGGFEKSGSDNSYVLLGGGGHKAESALRVSYASSAGFVAWDNVTGKPTMPSNITATEALIVTISGSTVTVNANLDDYKTPGEFNIFGTSNGDYAKMYVQSGIGDTFNGTRVITQTIKVTISHNTYAEICDVTRLYKSNAWSKWTVMYLGND